MHLLFIPNSKRPELRNPKSAIDKLHQTIPRLLTFLLPPDTLNNNMQQRITGPDSCELKYKGYKQ